MDSDTAREAISQLNGTTLDGREIVVREVWAGSKWFSSSFFPFTHGLPLLQDRDPASRRAHAVASAVVAPSFEGFGEGAVRLFIGNVRVVVGQLKAQANKRNVDCCCQLNWRVESRHLMEAFTEAGEQCLAAAGALTALTPVLFIRRRYRGERHHWLRWSLQGIRDCGNGHHEGC